jgi:hypothetical protein
MSASEFEYLSINFDFSIYEDIVLKILLLGTDYRVDILGTGKAIRLSTLLNDNIKKKILIYHNPDINCWESQLGTRVFIYSECRDYININNNYLNNKFNNDFIISYNNIKDPSWPVINSFNNFENLPEKIKKEFLEHIGVDSTKKYINQFIDSNCINFNGTYVYNKHYELIKNSELCFNIVDILNSNGDILLNKINSIVNV